MLPGDPKELATLVPIGRLGTPEGVADLAMAILGNGHIRNQLVGANGGLHPG
jgi:3-oxoacyl-[acyl-carrier protein] reductase